jgi:hypothetical protein
VVLIILKKLQCHISRISIKQDNKFEVQLKIEAHKGWWHLTFVCSAVLITKGSLKSGDFVSLWLKLLHANAMA